MAVMLVFNPPSLRLPLMSAVGPRVAAERETIGAMIGVYCRGVHGSRGGSLCRGCAELLGYASARLGACPFGEGKPTCRGCRVHCYDAGHRERIRAVMGYSGPRMIYIHPILVLRHLIL